MFYDIKECHSQKLVEGMDRKYSGIREHSRISAEEHSRIWNHSTKDIRVSGNVDHLIHDLYFIVKETDAQRDESILSTSMTLLNIRGLS